MALEIHPLIYFVRALARGSMQAAAADLDVRPSTVSRAVAALEYDLATPLIVRRPEGLRATMEGEQLKATAEVILGWALSLPMIVKGRANRGRGALSARRLAVLLAAPVSLRTFSHAVTAIEARSISAAARRLNISQPTLSRRIAELEGFLGAPLFVRTRAGAMPTPEAERLRMSVAEIEALAGRVMRRADVSFLHRIRDIRLGSVMPAGIDSSLTILLADLIEACTKRDANRFVSVSSGPAQVLMDEVMAGAIDAAIVDIPQVPDAFEHEEIAQRPLYVVAPAAVRRPADSAAALASRLPMALPMTGTGLRRAIDQLIDTELAAPVRTIECGSIPVLMRLVVNGSCCAIIPEGALPRSEPRVASIVIPGGRLVTSLIWLPGKRNSAPVRLIRDLVAKSPYRA